MVCLRCGWCCQNMSPLDNPYPCRHLSFSPDGLAVCAIYPEHPANEDKRPIQCQREDFGGGVCPIGQNKKK
jgi:hypothetical protein